MKINIVLVLSMLIFASCSASTANYVGISDCISDKGITIFKVVKDINIGVNIPECGQTWIPESFTGVGELGLKWKANILFDDRRKGAFAVSSYPYSWCWLNPSTGRFIEQYRVIDETEYVSSKTLSDGDVDQYLFSRNGITDGEYIIEEFYGGSMSTTKLVGRDAKSYNKIWEHKTERHTHFSMINGALIVYFLDTGLANISRLDPKSGKVVWIMESYGVKFEDIRSNAEYIFGVGKSAETGKCYLVRIDPTNSNHKSIEIPFMNTPSIAISKNRIWLFQQNGEYVSFDSESLSKDTLGNLPLHTFEIRNSYSNQIESIDDSLLITLIDTAETNDTKQKYILFDINNQATNEVDFTEIGKDKLYYNPVSVYVVNNNLIRYSYNSTESINPETLEPIWWIDLEKEDLGDNPRVIWCDWRGVLVMSDTKLACFTE